MSRFTQLDAEDNLGYQAPALRHGSSQDGHVRTKPSLDQLDHSNSSLSEFNAYRLDHQED